jgi:methionyl-tRNA formyltransferase
MSNTTQTSRLPQVLFLGMTGRFSYPSLCALLNAGIQVCAVIIPAEQSYGAILPVIQKRIQSEAARSLLPVLHATIHTSILELAREREIPVWEVRRLSDPETIKVFATYHPHLICVSCFSKRIPPAILDIPQLGCLNVHPSLLPMNRGPEPLFWTFRDGNQRTGVTIHLMDEGMDSGAIVAQEIIEIPDGISYSALEEQSAELGGNLLVQSVWDMYDGVARPRAQNGTQSSYHAFPSNGDFVVPITKWEARHVYNFICGVASWKMPLMLQVGAKLVRVEKALSYSRKAMKPKDTKVYKKPIEGFWVRCKQGSVLVV